MKRKVLIAIIGTLVFIAGTALSGMCEEVEGARKSILYGAFVDNYIQKCQAKADMLDSSSTHIRKDAIRATVKGAFIQSNRESMVKYLMAKNAPLNADRIEYHLNQKYAEVVFPQEVYIALVKDSLGQ